MSKLSSGTSKTMQLVPVHLDLPLFWKSHRATCPTCSPVYVILYHMNGSWAQRQAVVFEKFTSHVITCYYKTLDYLRHLSYIDNLLRQAAVLCKTFDNVGISGNFEIFFQKASDELQPPLKYLEWWLVVCKCPGNNFRYLHHNLHWCTLHS